MISFFVEDIEFKLNKKRILKHWIGDVCQLHHKKAGDINFIFCSDSYLLDINKTYLDHDYFTDIITFDQSENDIVVDADIYISIERVKENAEINQAEFDHELKRVIIHGMLHLLGFKDKTDKDKLKMRAEENKMLELI